MNAEFIALDQWHNAGMRYAASGRTKINSLERRTFTDCPDLKWAFWLGYGAATYRDYAEGQAVVTNLHWRGVMAERNITVAELRSEIEITEKDLAQMRAQLRILEGGRGGTIEQRIWSMTESPVQVRELSLKIGVSVESIGATAGKMVVSGLLNRVKPGVFQRVAQ